MNPTLERVIKHLNPVHDYDDIRFYNLSFVDIDKTNPPSFLVELGKRGVKDLYPII